MTSATDLVPDEFFQTCFNAFLAHDYGTNVKDLLVYNSTHLITQALTFKPTKETSVKAGRHIFEDLKTLVQTYGLEGTYFFSGSMFQFEGYDLTFDSLTLTIALSFAAVLGLLLIFTANILITICVAISLGMEFLIGLAAYEWFDIDINYTNIFHIYFMIPVLVSYNVHLALKYLQC